MLPRSWASAQRQELRATTALSWSAGELSENFRKSVNRAIKTFRAHPECKGCELVSISSREAIAELTINIEMLFAWSTKGQSPNGVRRQEIITARFPSNYPWVSPRFYFRDDFDRALPHLQPGPASLPPEPCLVYGSLDEYFLEVGLLALVEQLREWLSRAAKGALINPLQGWEPIIRNDFAGDYIADASYLRGLVNNRGGSRVLRTHYVRMGDPKAKLGQDAGLLGQIFSQKCPLNLKTHPALLSAETLDHDTHAHAGNSVTFVVWPGKSRDGSPIVANEYFPETIENLADLLERAKELHCEKALSGLLARIDRIYASKALDYPVPITIIFCVRRPFPLIDTPSAIELLPYAFDLRLTKGRDELMKQTQIPVVPIAQKDAISRELLERATGETAIAPVVMFGCGSVGSKIALHLARSGTQIRSVIDKAWFQPHNVARHGLIETSFTKKSDGLAMALRHFDQQPESFSEDILVAVSDKKTKNKLIPKQTGYVIDSTASLRVRSKLSSIKTPSKKTRFASVALFGRGHGAYLMIEGEQRSPTLDDVTVEYYRRIALDSGLRGLATAADGELQHVATGQGCGSMTMPMSDARASAMSALLAEQIVGANQSPQASGQLIIGLHETPDNTSSWSRFAIDAPAEVTFPGPEGWSFRIAERVLDTIREDITRYPGVETGGILIGRINDRLRTISVVDVLPAPPDSERSPTGFVLGTQGATQQIEDYHQRSGRTLYDVGTWHSHLADQPPSPRDQATARALAGERPPPFGLLIVSPASLYGVMHMD